jgi:hypothetical protein
MLHVSWFKDKGNGADLWEGDGFKNLPLEGAGKQGDGGESLITPRNGPICEFPLQQNGDANRHRNSSISESMINGHYLYMAGNTAMLLK